MLLGLLVVAIASALARLPLAAAVASGATACRCRCVYVAGVWVALVSACVFTGVYAFRVAEEARQLAKALNATEMVLAREQHLYALDGLAAAAAHELGTPLATIALVAKELEREFPPGSPHADDVALLRSQSQRCRDILARLTSLSGQADQHLARLPLSHLIEEVVEPYRAFAAEIVVDAAARQRRRAGRPPQPGDRPGPRQSRRERRRFRRDARSTVGTEWNDDEVAITIADDGPGFAAGIIDRIGEPYVTTRRDGQASAGGRPRGRRPRPRLLHRQDAARALRRAA